MNVREQWMEARYQAAMDGWSLAPIANKTRYAYRQCHERCMKLSHNGFRAIQSEGVSPDLRAEEVVLLSACDELVFQSLDVRPSPACTSLS
jgi:hypothetical protein